MEDPIPPRGRGSFEGNVRVINVAAVFTAIGAAYRLGRG